MPAPLAGLAVVILGGLWAFLEDDAKTEPVTTAHPEPKKRKRAADGKFEGDDDAEDPDKPE